MRATNRTPTRPTPTAVYCRGPDVCVCACVCVSVVVVRHGEGGACEEAAAGARGGDARGRGGTRGHKPQRYMGTGEARAKRRATVPGRKNVIQHAYNATFEGRGGDTGYERGRMFAGRWEVRAHREC
jgi:hypothetical protein